MKRQGEIRWQNVTFAQKHTQSQIRSTKGLPEARPIRYITETQIF